MCKYMFQLHYDYLHNLIMHLCLSIITLILDVHLLYLIVVYMYMKFIITALIGFVCIKLIAENIMTNRIKEL